MPVFKIDCPICGNKHNYKTDTKEEAWCGDLTCPKTGESFDYMAKLSGSGVYAVACT